MNASASALVTSPKAHNGKEQTDRPQTKVRKREKSGTITTVGKVVIGIGTVALLASLAATSINIGYYWLFPSALIILAGVLDRKEAN